MVMIIKIGGGKDINVEGVIKDLSNLDEPFVIIHGANYCRDNLFKDLGHEKKILTSVKGFSSVFSDEKMIDTILMAYSGLKNKRIVEMCQQNNINAIGLTGIDGGLVRGRRNIGIKVKENDKIKRIQDFSGKPKSINVELLNLLIGNGYVPVITIPILDENNIAINSENDDILNLVKDALNADKVIQLIEAPGYLEDINDKTSLLKNISKDELDLILEKVNGRMKRKILAIKKLFLNSECILYISDGRVENPITDALNGRGTMIK